MPDEAPLIEPTNSKPTLRKSSNWSMRLAVSGLAVAGLGVALSVCEVVWDFPAGMVVCLGFGAAGMALAVGSWLAGVFGRGRRRGLGCALPALGAAMSFLVILLPAASCPVRENARRANCKSNLRQIGLACHIYADDNGGWFPDNLERLYPKYVDNRRTFRCFSAQDSSAPNYRVVAGLNRNMNKSFILAYEPLENHPGLVGRNVLFTDAHVEWWPIEREAEFQRLLAGQRAAFEAWKKSGKPVESFGEFYQPPEAPREFYRPPWERKE